MKYPDQLFMVYNWILIVTFITKVTKTMNKRNDSTFQIGNMNDAWHIKKNNEPHMTYLYTMNHKAWNLKY